jgi:hypothetical protein
MMVRSLRIGLAGALLFILAGMFQACSAQDFTGPVLSARPHAPTADTCVWINGMIVCD